MTAVRCFGGGLVFGIWTSMLLAVMDVGADTQHLGFVVGTLVGMFACAAAHDAGRLRRRIEVLERRTFMPPRLDNIYVRSVFVEHEHGDLSDDELVEELRLALRIRPDDEGMGTVGEWRT